MAGTNYDPLIRHLRRLVSPRGDDGLSDAQLLERFRADRDEAAFEVLVWRHAGLVMGVCRRVLRHPQDAEDAFQATFLTLVRKADTIGRGTALPGWLYRVAYRVALAVRERSARRARRERPMADPPAAATTPVGGWDEVRPILDDEVNRLPEKYRLAFVLCCLEGLTTAEAARQLGCPPGTVGTRVARARERLRGRLTRRGVTLSAGALTAALAEPALAGAVPAPVLHETIRLALALAGGKAAGVVPASLLALVDYAVRPLLPGTKAWAALAFLGLTLAAGTGWALVASPSGSLSPPPSVRPAAGPAAEQPRSARLTLALAGVPEHADRAALRAAMEALPGVTVGTAAFKNEMPFAVEVADLRRADLGDLARAVVTADAPPANRFEPRLFLVLPTPHPVSEETVRALREALAGVPGVEARPAGAVSGWPARKCYVVRLSGDGRACLADFRAALERASLPVTLDQPPKAAR